MFYLGVNWQEVGRYQEKEKGVKEILFWYLLSRNGLAGRGQISGEGGRGLGDPALVFII